MISAYARDPRVIEPLQQRLPAPTICALSVTCTAWRDAAANPTLWRALCVDKWPWLKGQVLGDCDWKQRFVTLSQAGHVNGEDLNIDDYEFYMTARVAKPKHGEAEGDLLFSCLANWDWRQAPMYFFPPGDHADVDGAYLKATLPVPLALPEGLLIEDTDWIEDLKPLKLTIHAHHKPTLKVAHMLSFQVPDRDYDFEDPTHLESGRVGIGHGQWSSYYLTGYRTPDPEKDNDYGGCQFETPDWIGAIKHNNESCASYDTLAVSASLDFDDQRRLTSVEFALSRKGGGDGYEDASWDVPMHRDDLPTVLQALQWA